MIFDDLSDPECSCACHRNPGMYKHCMPCCGRCPHCGKRISIGWLESHTKDCPRRGQNYPFEEEISND